MTTTLAFVVAAAAGALARAEAGRRWNHHDGVAAGTLIVNVSGSFLLGLLSEVSAPTITVLGAGALGAYTTFSSFARDAAALAERRQFVLTASYVGASLGLGVAAAALGIWIAGR